MQENIKYIENLSVPEMMAELAFSTNARIELTKEIASQGIFEVVNREKWLKLAEVYSLSEEQIDSISETTGYTDRVYISLKEIA